MFKHLAVHSILCVAFAVLCGGCVSVETEIAGYIPRGASTDKVATLQGGWAVYIDQVDGGDIESAVNTTSNFGSNRVRVLPGKHVVSVRIYRSGSEGTGMMTRNWKTEQHLVLNCILEANHTYVLESYSAQRMKVTDKSTGQTFFLDAAQSNQPYGFAQR